MPKLGGWVQDVDTKIFAEFAELAEFRIDTGKTHNAAPQANTCFPTLDPKNRVWARMHGTVGGQSAACAPSFFFFLKKAFQTAVGAQTIIPYVGVGSYVRRCYSEREIKNFKSKIIYNIS